MHRLTSDELMDDPGVDPRELDRSLRFIRWVNRRLGGTSALLGALRRWSRHWPRDRSVTLLDVATGSADLPIAARKWALANGFDLRVTGIDVHETTLRLARAHLDRQPEDVRAGVTLESLDAFGLVDRFGVGSFDHAHAGLFLHHLKTDVRAMTLLAQMERVARGGVAVNDLRRSRLGLLGSVLLTLRAPAIVQNDARASVRAAFTPREAEALAERAGLTDLRVTSSVLAQRWLLTTTHEGAWS